MSKRPDETDEDDSEADQGGVPDQQDGRTSCNGGVQDGKDTRQLQTNQNEHEAIQQKDEHLPHGVRLEPCPGGKEGGGTPRQIETCRHGCQDPRHMQHLFAKQVDGKWGHQRDRNFQGGIVQPTMDVTEAPACH